MRLALVVSLFLHGALVLLVSRSRAVLDMGGSDISEALLVFPYTGIDSAGATIAKKFPGRISKQVFVPGPGQGRGKSEGNPPWPFFLPSPQYPEAARRERLEGRVRVLLETGADGHVISAEVTESSGEELLDEAALSAVKAWRLAPRVKHEQSVVFRLR